MTTIYIIVAGVVVALLVVAGLVKFRPASSGNPAFARNTKRMMNDSLKQKVVPVLRENGFRGSFPHFYRVGDEAIDLLNVQHHKHDGGFRLNIGRVPVAGQVDADGKVVAPRVLQIANLGMEKRAQIKPERDVGRDGWYRFDRHPCWEVFEAALARIMAKDHWAKLPLANPRSREV